MVYVREEKGKELPDNESVKKRICEKEEDFSVGTKKAVIYVRLTNCFLLHLL